MVQAMIKIADKTNRVLNIIKAKYGLKDKSQAIDTMAEIYEQSLLEPELRPEFKKRLSKIIKGKYISGEELDRRLRNVR